MLWAHYNPATVTVLIAGQVHVGLAFCRYDYGHDFFWQTFGDNHV